MTGEPGPYPGEFLRVIIGSTIHGLNVPGTYDLDLMGVRIEWPGESIGLAQPFEQYVWRTQPDGQPSGPGDVDLTVYSLRKWLRLAAKGNPTVLNLLFVPPAFRHVDDPFLAGELRHLTPKIVSRATAWRYRGYLRAQRERLIGERGQKHTGYTRRLKYLADAGWDTKYAMHMIRLGLQGIELMETGRITLPMPEPVRTEVYNVRLGRVEMADVVEWAEMLEGTLEHLAHHADLRAEPDTQALNSWLVSTYLKAWTDA
jgi:predicted nucleotidyltransferase